MSYTYCKSCGHKNLYALQVPKFCGECGAPLGLNHQTASPAPVLAAVNKTKRKKRTRIIEEEYAQEAEDLQDIQSVPNINNFQYTASSSGMNRTMKLQDLVQLDEQEGQLEEEKLQKGKTRRKRTSGKN